jgi:ferritin-like metal-binding protein YciE
MNELKTMRDLLAHDLQMLYNAEKLGVEAQAMLAEKASDPQLRSAFERHGTETEQQVARLEQIMATMEIKPSRESNAAVKGLMSDSEKLMRKESTPEVLDAMLIAAAQKMEHYEIACYGTAVRMTKDLGLTEAAELLSQTLEEEKKTDEILNKLAKQRVNAKAEAKM